MEPNAFKVGFMPHAHGGCYWYRIKNPKEALERAGVKTEIVNWGKDIDINEFKTFQFYGTYPYSIENILKYLKAEGKRIIYDVDDALSLIEETNVHFYGIKADLSTFYQCLEYADHVTTTTQRMKDYLSKLTKAEISIIPNCYNRQEWTERKRAHKSFRIGFCGGMSHVPDLIGLGPQIKRFQKQFPDSTFIIAGLGDTDYDTWFRYIQNTGNEKLKKVATKLDKELNGVKFEWVPFVNYENWPRLLAELDLDVGLCPLKDTPFNRCKSNCKAYEYAMVDTFPVASKVPPYSDEVQITSVDSFLSVLQDIKAGKLLEDKEMIKKFVDTNRNIDNYVEELKKIYLG